MAIIHLNHIDLSQNELQNAVIQNLATAPSSPREGQTYWNSSSKKWMIFNGTEWQECAKQYILPPATATTLGGVIVGSNLKVAADGTISTDIQGAASTVIENNLTAGRVVVSDGTGKIAVSDITTTELGYLDGATSNIQTQLDTLDNKIDSLDDGVVHLAGAETITGKKTFNAGLTNEATVAQSDNSTNVATTSWVTTKVSTVDATAVHKTGDETITGAKNFTGATVTVATQTAGDNSTKAASTAFVTKAIADEDALVVHLAGAETVSGVKTFSAGLKSGQTIAANSNDTTVPTTAWVKKAIADKITLKDLSIATGSTNYLAYNNTNGQISAKVDTVVTEDSTNLITSGAVKTAINAALVGALIYQGTWTATGQTDYSSIGLPVQKGYMYMVTGSTTTIDGVEWNPGDYLVINEDVATGGTITSAKVEKIDNTESADIVRLNATQTVTNKTINADNNTVTNLETDNFKSGVIVKTVGATGSDTAIPTEKAVRSAINTSTSGMVTLDGAQTLTNKTLDADDNTIKDLTVSNLKSGVLQTTVRASSSATDTTIVSEKAVAKAVEALPHKYTTTNPALTQTGGICTWTVTHGLKNGDVIATVKRVSDGCEVIPEVSYTASTVVIKINSTSNITAGTYKVVVIG